VRLFTASIRHERRRAEASPPGVRMIAICFKCGASKSAPLERCPSCGSIPAEGEESTLSLALTDRFLLRARLAEVAQLLASGQTVRLPADVGELVRKAAEGPRGRWHATKRKSNLPEWVCSSIVGIAVVLCFIIYTAWPHYQWSVAQDSIPAYSAFLERFPSSRYSDRVRNRLNELREPAVWSQTRAADDIGVYRMYIRTYPEHKNSAVALARVEEIADSHWPAAAHSRSVQAIGKFLKDYPETTMSDAAKRRIQELRDDWDWVREQDSLKDYRRFAKRFPAHPEHAWIQKRIIDLEVDAIASGQHGELPRAQRVKSDGVVAELRVENETGYELTVRYSGPDSSKVVIQPRDSATVTLPPGEYRVAASVSAPNVNHYYGRDTLVGGRYSSKFVIRSQDGRGSVPSYRR
jgi:hypothetical protein